MKALGKDTWNLTKKVENIHVKLGICKNHTVFNLRCEKMGLEPHSLKFRSLVPSFRAQKSRKKQDINSSRSDLD